MRGCLPIIASFAIIGVVAVIYWGVALFMEIAYGPGASEAWVFVVMLVVLLLLVFRGGFEWLAVKMKEWEHRD